MACARRSGRHSRAWLCARLARKRRDLRVQLGRDRDTFRVRALALLDAPLARQPYIAVLEHRAHQRLHALEVDLSARERIGIDGEEGLPDARRAPFVGEE